MCHLVDLDGMFHFYWMLIYLYDSLHYLSMHAQVCAHYNYTSIVNNAYCAP